MIYNTYKYYKYMSHKLLYIYIYVSDYYLSNINDHIVFLL